MSDENQKPQEDVRPVVEPTIEPPVGNQAPEHREAPEEYAPWGEPIRRPRRPEDEQQRFNFDESSTGEQQGLPGFDQPRVVLPAAEVLERLAPLVEDIWNIFREEIEFYYSLPFAALTDRGNSLAHSVYIQHLVVTRLRTIFRKETIFDVPDDMNLDQHINGMAAFFRVEPDLTLRIKKMRADGTHKANRTKQSMAFDNQQRLERLPEAWSNDTHINLGYVPTTDGRELSHIIIACPIRHGTDPQWYVAYRGPRADQESGPAGDDTSPGTAAGPQLFHLLLPSDQKSQ